MSDWTYKIINSDCIEAMRGMEDNSIDSIVTDPPYGLSFMGKKWDYDVPSVEVWTECFRILKPGGHLLAFAGTRTQHRMAVRIEDAGFEIRDMIAWVYGSGFPKSLDVSKAIDKAAGVEREVVGVAGKSSSVRNSMAGDFAGGEYMSTTPSTEAAKQWEGWGTALKPALEPITVARKPVQGTVADNVLKWGTGGINVDGCRVGTDEIVSCGGLDRWNDYRHGKSKYPTNAIAKVSEGRFPANFIHDGSDEVVGMFPQTAKIRRGLMGSNGDDKGNAIYGKYADIQSLRGHNDNGGSAARFFYCAKASKNERNLGLQDLEPQRHADRIKDDGLGGDNLRNRSNTAKHNHHPTVKPIDLMRYLCRLVTPPGGKVLDPFMGSGTTLLAAYDEGFNCIGIERDSEYAKIAEARVKAYSKQGKINL